MALVGLGNARPRREKETNREKKRIKHADLNGGLIATALPARCTARTQSKDPTVAPATLTGGLPPVWSRAAHGQFKTAVSCRIIQTRASQARELFPDYSAPHALGAERRGCKADTLTAHRAAMNKNVASKPVQPLGPLASLRPLWPLWAARGSGAAPKPVPKSCPHMALQNSKAAKGDGTIDGQRMGNTAF
jgi:hypothetical protein